MFKDRFLNLISNDFGLSGGDFLTASLPVHINDANMLLMNQIGNTNFKQALDETPQLVSDTSDVSGNIQITISDTTVFEDGDYIILEGSTNYNGTTYILSVDSSTKLTLVMPYVTSETGYYVRTKLRHDIELAGSYLTAKGLVPTLIKLNEGKSVTITGTTGQGNWTREGVSNIKDIQNIYQDRANQIIAPYLDGDESIEGLQMELI